jgi:outer membrane protein assembly factor BamB
MLACDERRSGSSAACAPTAAPERVWARPLGHPVYDSGRQLVTLLAGDRAVVATVGAVEAFSPGGERLFVTASPRNAVTSLVVALPGDRVLVSAAPGELYALDARRGEVRVRSSVAGGVRGSPLALADGTTLVPVPGGLVAVDSDLEPGRRVALPLGRSFATPARLPDGRVLVLADEALVALDARGEIVGRVELGARGVEYPVVALDGTAWIVGESPGDLLIVDAARMRVRARVPAGALGVPVALAPDGSARLLVQGARGPGSSALVAISPTGRERWRRELPGVARALSVDATGSTLVSLMGPRPVGVGTTALGATPGFLLALDEEGHERWRITHEGTPIGPPLLGESGGLFVLVAGAPGMPPTLEFWR